MKTYGFIDIYKKINLSRDKNYWERYRRLSKKSTLNLSKKLAKIIGFSQKEIEKQDCLREIVWNSLVLVLEQDYFGKVGFFKNCISKQGEQIYFIDFVEKDKRVRKEFKYLGRWTKKGKDKEEGVEIYNNIQMLLLDRENLFKLVNY
jgi:hypothetical protein